MQSTNAEPTTAASANSAMARACSAVLIPKPTAIGSLVLERIYSTDFFTFWLSGVPTPVMPAMLT